MPDPFNRTKMSGDTHPPEVESDPPLGEGSADALRTSPTPTARGAAAERGHQARPRRGVDKAGLPKNKESRPDKQRDSER